MSYDYNLDGSLKTMHYPAGPPSPTRPIPPEDMLSAVDTGNNINYVTGASYQADSRLTGFVSGNGAAFAGITNTSAYNKRLQPSTCRPLRPARPCFPSAMTSTWERTPEQTTATSGASPITKTRRRNQTFTYDLLNRLTSAQNAGTNCAATTSTDKTEYWGNSYGYDAWGNLTGKTVTKCSAENLSAHRPGK